MRLVIGLLVAALIGSAGCTDNGDDGADQATLAFDSEGENRDGVQSKAAECTEGAALSGVGSIDEGLVIVTVSDGDGNEVFRNTYADAMDIEGELIDGADGAWQLKTERVGGFDGDYSFSLVCN